MTARKFLIHGLIAGFFAGVAAFIVAFTVGEPYVNDAIALEESGGHTHAEGEDASHSHEDPVVSRDVQSTIGLAAGTIGIGVVVGGVIGLLSALGLGRLGTLKPMASTAVVVAVGWLAYSLVPFLKYPSTPPAVGSGDTIDERTAWFFGFLVISIAAAVGAVLLARGLAVRSGAYVAVVAAVAAYVAVMTLTALALPAVNEIGDFPGDILWGFRVSTLLTFTTMWAVLGVVLVGLTERSWQKMQADVRRRELAASL